MRTTRAEGVWQLRRLPLAIRGWDSNTKPVESLRQRSCANSRVRCNEQGFAEAWVPLRRIDDLLCVHAGGRNGQRPHAELFPTQRSKERHPTKLIECCSAAGS